MFKGLDHVAILVTDTEQALEIYRDRLGLPVLFSEVVNNGAVRLTHLDLGNTHLQLVQPLSRDHPLHDHLQKHGPGLHHICLAVDDVQLSMAQGNSQGLKFAQPNPHQGPKSKRAAFIETDSTGGVQIEITGA